MRRVISVFSRPGRRTCCGVNRASAPPPDRPLVTACMHVAAGEPAAADHAARSLGLLPGMPVAQAQAPPGLTVVPAQPEMPTVRSSCWPPGACAMRRLRRLTS